MMKGKSQGKALPVICKKFRQIYNLKPWGRGWQIQIARRIWDACGQLQTWGTKTQTRIQHGGRSSTSACEENLVKKSHGNEGKRNFTYLDTLKSYILILYSSTFLCIGLFQFMKRKAESDYRRQLEEERQRAIEESHWVVEGQENEDR